MEKPWEIDLTIYEDEQELLEGLRRHDRMACTCLMKRFAPRLYRVALHLAGTPDEAEDVLQEGFIQACAKIDTFRGDSGLGTWLHRIVLNAALMRLRRKRPDTVALVPPDASAAAVAIVNHHAQPDADVVSQELRSMIERAVLALPDTLRAAFVLRDVEGINTKDAAALLGIGESALKVRLHRAHLALRDQLAPYLATESNEGVSA